MEALPIKHKHTWGDSRTIIGLVGTLYPSIYPYACRCGALMHADGTIIEPKEKVDVDNPPPPTIPTP